jgi:hypothetical protein
MFESPGEEVIQNGEFTLGQDDGTSLLRRTGLLFTPSQFEEQGTGL